MPWRWSSVTRPRTRPLPETVQGVIAQHRDVPLADKRGEDRDRGRVRGHRHGCGRGPVQDMQGPTQDAEEVGTAFVAVVEHGDGPVEHASRGLIEDRAHDAPSPDTPL